MLSAGHCLSLYVSLSPSLSSYVCLSTSLFFYVTSIKLEGIQ